LLNIDLVELVTSFVDNELDDEEDVERIKLLLEKDENLKIEYQVQNLVKNSLSNRFSHAPTPSYLEERIKKNILKEINKKSVKNSSKISLPQIFARPIFVVPAVVIVIIVSFFLLVTKPTEDFYKIIKSQNGNSNMLVQAVRNFKNLVDGKLNVQVASNSSKVISDYFMNHGVTYQTYIPVFNDLPLIGGVISENNGEKFAHHIYRCKSGKYVYVYQVNENCIKKEKTLHLSGDLMKLIDEGQNCADTIGDSAVIIWKCNQNINILVSNEKLEDIKDKFLAYK
jgi:hypothetical protein